MTKRTCKQCGALTEGVRFCTSCGAIISRAETASVITPETRPLFGEQADQTIPGEAGVTEELPSARTAARKTPRTTARKAPSDYDTEEIPQTRTTAQASAPAKSALANQSSANQSSRGRKGLLLAAALGAVVLSAGLFFFANSGRSSETQTANQPVDKGSPDASAQPTVQPSVQSSGAPANNQAQPQSSLQTGPAAGEVKSPAGRNSEAASKPAQAPSEAKPTPAPPEEKKAADGTGAAQHNFNQGITYMNAGRYQEALREFGYVKNLDPGNKSVYYLIGQTYHKLGQLERALEAYRQCTSGVYASVARNNVKMLEKKQ